MRNTQKKLKEVIDKKIKQNEKEGIKEENCKADKDRQR